MGPRESSDHEGDIRNTGVSLLPEFLMSLVFGFEQGFGLIDLPYQEQTNTETVSRHGQDFLWQGQIL